ncbi:MAG: HD-GYP domain-containing protein [Lachnospiraceae bacterium]|nr:HD-GYP domain-containing protein [Lachnospiraceae bacterium]
MSKSQNEDLFTAWVKVGLILMLAITILMMFIATVDSNTKGEASVGSFGTKDFNEGWLLTQNDITNTVSLPAYIDSSLGDEIIISNTLPSNISNGMSLMVRASMQDVVIYIDGRLREEYSSNSTYDMSTFLPSAYVVTELNGTDAGKDITIHITVKNKGSINAISYGHGNNVWFPVIRNGLWVNILAVIELISGALASLSAYALGKKYRTQAMGYLGLLMMDVSLWMLSESTLRQIIFTRPSMSQYFSYMTLELLGALACMYFDAVQHRIYHKRYVIAEAVVLLQILINIILHITGTAEFYQTLAFTHVLEAACAVLVIVNLVTDAKYGRIASYRMSAIGALVFVGFSVCELIFFYASKFRNHFGVFICSGLLALLIFTVIQMVMDVLAMFREKDKIRMDMTGRTIETIAGAIDARDEYTGGHSERVGLYAQALARQMADEYDFSEEDILRIHYIGLIHDIGKIGVADSVLNKAGKLTDEEFSLMKKHSEIGYEIMSSLGEEIEGALDGIRYHHERFDGRGYPDGLAGEGIPLIARILCLADSYDAMTSNRVYRKRLTREEVIGELKKCSGTQFDPKLADIFITLLESGKISEVTIDGLAAGSMGEVLESAKLEGRLQSDLQAGEKIIHPSHVRMLCYMIKLMEKKDKQYTVMYIGVDDDPQKNESEVASARMKITSIVTESITEHDINIRYNERLNVVALFDRTDEEVETFADMIRARFPESYIA